MQEVSCEAPKDAPIQSPTTVTVSSCYETGEIVSLGGLKKLSFFAITFFFRDHFEELQTVLSEVKLIINNAPLTYVYPNNIKTYLTPNLLLFGRRL